MGEKIFRGWISVVDWAPEAGETTEKVLVKVKKYIINAEIKVQGMPDSIVQELDIMPGVGIDFEVFDNESYVR